MLEENVATEEVSLDEQSPGKQRVSCFICKREVEQKGAKLLDHPKEKRVWVCQDHIK